MCGLLCVDVYCVLVVVAITVAVGLVGGCGLWAFVFCWVFLVWRFDCWRCLGLFLCFLLFGLIAWTCDFVGLLLWCLGCLGLLWYYAW